MRTFEGRERSWTGPKRPGRVEIERVQFPLAFRKKGLIPSGRLIIDAQPDGLMGVGILVVGQARKSRMLRRSVAPRNSDEGCRQGKPGAWGPAFPKIKIAPGGTDLYMWFIPNKLSSRQGT